MTTTIILRRDYGNNRGRKIFETHVGQIKSMTKMSTLAPKSTSHSLVPSLTTIDNTSSSSSSSSSSESMIESNVLFALVDARSGSGALIHPSHPSSVQKQEQGGRSSKNYLPRTCDSPWRGGFFLCFLFISDVLNGSCFLGRSILPISPLCPIKAKNNNTYAARFGSVLVGAGVTRPSSSSSSSSDPDTRRRLITPQHPKHRASRIKHVLGLLPLVRPNAPILWHTTRRRRRHHALRAPIACLISTHPVPFRITYRFRPRVVLIGISTTSPSSNGTMSSKNLNNASSCSSLRYSSSLNPASFSAYFLLIVVSNLLNALRADTSRIGRRCIPVVSEIRNEEGDTGDTP